MSPLVTINLIIDGNKVWLAVSFKVKAQCKPFKFFNTKQGKPYIYKSCLVCCHDETSYQNYIEPHLCKILLCTVALQFTVCRVTVETWWFN